MCVCRGDIMFVIDLVMICFDLLVQRRKRALVSLPSSAVCDLLWFRRICKIIWFEVAFCISMDFQIKIYLSPYKLWYFKVYVCLWRIQFFQQQKNK